MSIQLNAATRILSSEAEDKKTKAAINKAFPKGKFPPKANALETIKGIKGVVDQFTDKVPTASDWRNEDAEKTKGGDWLYLCFGGDAEEFALDYETQTIHFV